MRCVFCIKVMLINAHKCKKKIGLKVYDHFPVDTISRIHPLHPIFRDSFAHVLAVRPQNQPCSLKKCLSIQVKHKHK